MTLFKYLTGLALVSIAACTPTGGTPIAGEPSSSNVVGGLAPPPGQTEAERQASKDYYRGPRGNEF
jgi:hypothetical protein